MTSIAIVVAQIVALVFVMWPWKSQHFNAWGCVGIAIAIALNAWMLWHNRPSNFSVLPEPRENAQLITSGPYRYVRHPLYTGLMLFALGCAIGWNTWVHWAAAATLSLVLHIKAAREERLLALHFADYRVYAERTGRFVPRWQRKPGAQ